MSQNDPTFESVNQHIESASGDLKELETQVGTRGAEDVVKQACKAYKIIRPILQLIGGTPFIPGSWKSAIKVFMSLMDGLCPST